MPAHHDVRPSDVIMRRLHGTWPRPPSAGRRISPSCCWCPGVGARTVRSLAMVAEVVHGAPCRFSRSGALLARPWRQGPPSVPGADQGLRPDDRRAEDRGAARRSSGATRSSTRSGGSTSRRAGSSAPPAARRSTRSSPEERERSHAYGGRSVFGWETPQASAAAAAVPRKVRSVPFSRWPRLRSAPSICRTPTRAKDTSSRSPARE